MGQRIVIVGSGVAGGIVAREALARGSEVVMIESGPRVRRRDARIWYDLLMGSRDPYAACRLPDSALADSASADYLRGKLLRMRGGSTVHWDGWSFRLREEDFALASNTGRGMDWPITYDQLEPYYAEAERTLRVAGDAHDVDHPRRSGPFPLPAFPFQQADERFLNGLHAVGAEAHHTCIARNTRAIDGHPACQTIGTCLYCPITARFTGDLLVDELEAHPSFRLLEQTEAMRVDLDDRGNATGVTVRAHDSNVSSPVDGDVVVICGGALFTPHLLLRSTSPSHPDGLGNRAGHVGRHLMNHTGVVGISAQGTNPEHETNELYLIQTAMSRSFDTVDQQKVGKFQLQQDLRHDTDIEGRTGPLVRLMMEGRSARDIRRKLDGAVFRALLPMVEELPLAESRVSLSGDGKLRVEHHLDPRVLDAIERAKTICAGLFEAMDCRLVQWLEPGPYAHLMGTCRMSAAPDAGVVDADLRVWGTENVYACGSAVFPSTGAVQPTLTIAALAHRLGEHLADR